MAGADSAFGRLIAGFIVFADDIPLRSPLADQWHFRYSPKAAMGSLWLQPNMNNANG